MTRGLGIPVSNGEKTVVLLNQLADSCGPVQNSTGF